MSVQDWCMALVGAVGIFALMYELSHWDWCDFTHGPKRHKPDAALGSHQGGESSALVIYPEFTKR